MITLIFLIDIFIKICLWLFIIFWYLAAFTQLVWFYSVHKYWIIKFYLGLRKVTKDMQTHKNPQLRQGPAPFKAAAPKVPTKALPTPGAGVLPDKPPVFARDGKKWIIVSLFVLYILIWKSFHNISELISFSVISIVYLPNYCYL